ncbi:hypothetical protein BDF20DRAFT_842435 [Mycotypha africana]|uniref:uncharacterized protein n=1 Tax=Mycotypha africana TaxID=64632 RepID=UPI002301CC82|nr:uncharacterized protein BDF20DRAFT_842435 [Mycotypha africana]KAI8991062.1 hypothetical protein BDF20DRAFT_842435 [Mycotypha africana]
MPFGWGAKFCKQWARISLWSFFSDIQVKDIENADCSHGPIIFAATHHNMLMDPAVLNKACTGLTHWWAKKEVFIENKYWLKFLYSSGLVPVDRKAKDHTSLYKETFDVLELNESLVIFPEGTSHTLPSLGKLKDGASFVALEYNKALKDYPSDKLNQHGQRPKPASIVPVGIVYTDKSKYRSQVIVRFGQTIHVNDYLSDYEKDPKTTAKRVTRRIEDSLISLTINAPDWTIGKGARMARELLFPGEYGLMHDFVPVTQSLIRILKEKPELAQACYAYREDLNRLSLRDTDMMDLTPTDASSSPATAHMNVNVNHRYVLKDFFMKTHTLLFDLPILLPAFVIHFPLYVMARHYTKVQPYEEVLAQEKIFYASLSVMVIYSSLFLFSWYYVYHLTLYGMLFTGLTLAILFWMHTEFIDSKYEAFKQWKGAAILLDAFVLKRDGGRRQQAIMALVNRREQLQKELLDVVWAAAATTDPVSSSSSAPSMVEEHPTSFMQAVRRVQKALYTRHSF